jgi:hypothetical protein
VLPEYWDRGVAQRLLETTMTVFDRWGVRHTGLFTFPQSAKHVDRSWITARLDRKCLGGTELG